MRIDTTLAAVAALLLVVTVVGPVAVPGALAEGDSDPVRAGEVGIGDVTVRTVDVGGEIATIGVRTYLDKRGGPVENVTIRLRAIGDGGLVADTEEVPVGDLTDGASEVSVEGQLALERTGDYRIETLLYVDDLRIERGRLDVSGFETLQPDYERSPVAFRTFEAGLPTIEYTIADVSNDRATLDVTAYLLNRGADPADGYRLRITARQVDSNIVADRITVDLGSIGAGETATPSGLLTVPTGYNYYLDATLWRGDVLVGTARSGAALAPNGSVDVPEASDPGGLVVEDFASDSDDPPSNGDDPGETFAPGDGGAVPGFTALLGAVALLASLAIIRRQYYE